MSRETRYVLLTLLVTSLVIFALIRLIRALTGLL